MEALEQLKSVLCDPEGSVCISGSDGDRKVIADALESLEQQVAALTKEHEFACEIGADYRDKWMAAQAREAKLREALERIVKWDSFPATGKYWDDPNGCQPMSYSAAYGSNGERDFMRSVAVTALASPTDNSALMERLKQERERCADAMWQAYLDGEESYSKLHDAIRGLA